MASLGQIANEVKALVEQIKSNTNATKNNTSAIKNTANQIKADLDTLLQINSTGFSNLSQGIFTQILLQVYDIELSKIRIQQNETIICHLNNIANVACQIKQNTDQEIALLEEILDTQVHVRRVLDLEFSHNAGIVSGEEKIEVKVAECCPEKPEPKEPCFEPCRPPKYNIPRPPDLSWKPLGGRDRGATTKPAAARRATKKAAKI